MAGNPILVEVSESQDLTTAAANRRAKFILGFAHQLGQFRYIRRDPSCLIFGERFAAEGRPGAQPKKGPGRPAKYDLRDCDERCFLRAPRESCLGAGSQLALIDGDHSLAKALQIFENLAALAAPNSIVAIHDVVPMTWMPEAGQATAYQFYAAPRRAELSIPLIAATAVGACPLLAQSGHSLAARGYSATQAGYLRF